MTSPIAPIGATSALGPIAPISIPDVGGTESTSGSDFAVALSKGIENLQAVQSKADDLAVQAADGTLTDVHEYTIASTEAALATELTVAVRNKAVEAFQEIMRMQA